MTRKHFEALAASLKLTRPEGPGSSEYQKGAEDQWNYTVGHLVNFCHAQNASFSPTRFIQACGGYI